MMRTPKHLDSFAPEMIAVWNAGWGIRLHRTPVGVFFRLESGILYRGGTRGWWWRPAVGQAMRTLASKAKAHPRYTPPAPEGEW